MSANINVASCEWATRPVDQRYTSWDIVNGVTAYARSIQNTDDRVALEQKAGKLIEAVSA